jgi:hypothetical protein
MCLCARITRVDNRTGVWVLQHPRERTHHIGTARLARLGLANVHVEIAWNAGVKEDVAPSWLPSDAALLYPSPHALDLADVAPAEQPKNLLVIDGTWHTARTLYRDKSWLHRLPHYRFSPAAPSRYRLRREPQRDYVSTIEAIVEALRMLEPNTQGFDELLRAFDSMIDDQAEHIGKKLGTPRKRKRRPEAQRRTPRALVEELRRIVVAYVETSRPAYGVTRELVHVTAVALGTGATFERFIEASCGPPQAPFLGHMRLSEEDFVGACAPRDFLADWLRFLGEVDAEPLLAAWNQGTLDLLAAAVGSEQPSQLSLKSAYRAVYGADARDLAAAMAKLELLPESVPFRGRAALRLGSAVAIARHLNARANASPAVSDSLPPAD